MLMTVTFMFAVAALMSECLMVSNLLAGVTATDRIEPRVPWIDLRIASSWGTVTLHYQPNFKGRLREELRKARGRNVRTVLAKLQ